MHKKVIRRVGWVANPTNPQAVRNVRFDNSTYSVTVRDFVSLFLAFHYMRRKHIHKSRLNRVRGCATRPTHDLRCLILSVFIDFTIVFL